MRLSRFYIPTLREVPQEAENISHILMLRAGFIRKVANGIYTILPAALKVIRKIETIVRDEMNKKGGVEIFMPSVQPASLWEQSGRLELYGKELLRFKDRHDKDYCFGPTHEELVTDLVKRDTSSSKRLPVLFYQIQTKFRDEIRPRFGLMRAREFTMKDGYSFDVDDESCRKSYLDMKDAYEKIFNRIGLEFRSVKADSGQIGGSKSSEFMVMADSGEDRIGYCSSCQFAANIDTIKILSDESSKYDEKEFLPLEKIYTKDIKTIEDLEKFLSIDRKFFVKTLIYKTDKNEIIAVLVRGDRSVNNLKLVKGLDIKEAYLVDEKFAVEKLNLPVGYLSAVSLDMKIYADNEIKGMRNFISGANEKDYHLKNINYDRDFKVDKFLDLREAVDADRCPECKEGSLTIKHAIEVGHIFILGSKYSEKLGAVFKDKDGLDRPMIMGCYGIGIGRTAAASIEQNHDKDGIIWPAAISPFEVVLIPVSHEKEVIEKAESLYNDFLESRIDLIIDDRDLRGGVKFADADLIGYPLQVIIGKKGIKTNQAEIKIRRSSERIFVSFDKLKETLKSLLLDL